MSIRFAMPSPEQDGSYFQNTLEGLEAQGESETVLEYVVVENLPTYRKNGKGYEWGCVVYCPPDIFNQDRNETYEVHAKTYAPEAKKKRLRPGDIVTMKGARYTQAVQFNGGEERAINHLTVTDISVIRRAKRESITVYERQQGK